MLAQAVDIRRWLHDDRQVGYAERLDRDRTIGRGLQVREPVPRVLAWWREVAPDPAPLLGARIESGRRIATAVLVLAGLLLGLAVGGVAFAYDGRHPLNLFTLLGVLVGLPGLMLLLTLALLPGRIPGLGTLQAVAAGMSPGRWVGAWLDRLLGAELFAPGLLRGGGTAAFSRWQLAVFSQWLGLGFFGGVLAIALLLVAFTDLAFGWSTTLQMSSDRVAGWVTALSTPWAGWLPQAAPDASLVEASRYARLDDAALPPQAVERLGGWWPFVLMTVLCYGALPRLLLLVVGLWRLRGATRRLLTDDPEVTALLDRLDAPLLDLGGGAPEDPGQPQGAAVSGPAADLAGPASEGLLVLVWNAAGNDEAVRRWLGAHLGVVAGVPVQVGILQNEAQRHDALDAADRAQDGAVRRVIVVTKGWEPPLLEFMDFLGQVRAVFGAQASLTVVPLDVSAAAVRGPERDVWARALARLKDPRLYVAEAVGGDRVAEPTGEAAP